MNKDEGTGVLFDTNILVYSDDTADAAKQARAVSLLAGSCWTITGPMRCRSFTRRNPDWDVRVAVAAGSSEPRR